MPDNCGHRYQITSRFFIPLTQQKVTGRMANNEYGVTLVESKSVVLIVYMRSCIYSPRSTIGRTIRLSYLPPT
jgi:hypothetical protein